MTEEDDERKIKPPIWMLPVESGTLDNAPEGN